MGVPNSAVKNCVIWGNHSSTQYPDLTYAVVNVGGKEVKAREAIKDDNWVKNDFVKVLLASLHDNSVHSLHYQTLLYKNKHPDDLYTSWQMYANEEVCSCRLFSREGPP